MCICLDKYIKYFDTFSEIHFWPTDPKMFLKAPMAPIYTNSEGERAPKKRDFFVKIFQKVAKNWLFWQFFQKLACGAENFAKIGAKQCFGRAQKINLVDLKKRSSKFLKFFWKSAPPLEKILDPPLVLTMTTSFHRLSWNCSIQLHFNYCYCYFVYKVIADFLCDFNKRQNISLPNLMSIRN